MDHVPSAASTATARERLLMECDRQGQILWMNRRARNRLGPMENLFAAVPALHVVQITHLLSSREPGLRPRLISSLQCADRPSPVPVHLVRLLALENRVVLSAEVRARASDALPSQDTILRTLLDLQSKAVRNYFRLLRAQESLQAGSVQSNRPVAAVVTGALEAERKRIAHELHSGANQTLAGIKLNLELIEARMPDAPEVVKNGLQRISSLADQALSEVRSVSQRLNPPDWRGLDLGEAVRQLWNTTGIPDKFHATLVIQPLKSDVPDAVRIAVYRAAQEGLANVYWHSGATEVKLTLSEQNGRIDLTLEDNGSGFDVSEVLYGAPPRGARGLGLRAMREQILALDGQFHIEGGAGGTRMQVSVPITESR